MSVRDLALAAVLETFPFLLRPEERSHLRTTLFSGDAYPDPRCSQTAEIRSAGALRCGRGHRVTTNWPVWTLLGPCPEPPDVRVTRVAGEPCDEVFAWPEVFAAWDARHAAPGRYGQGRLW